MGFDFLIVGAGYAGAVCARELADAGYTILLIDKRDHIAGNAFDKRDEHGILIHPYGPHIFHTNSKRVFAWLSRFTDWRFYEHRVLANVGGDLYPIPINRTTINKVFGLNLAEDEVESFLEKKRTVLSSIKTSEDVVLSSVGSELCDLFFRGYTKKQWDLDLSELSAGVAARIPTRTNDDDRYFGDSYQFMPSEGYTAMFERILNSDRITVRTGLDFFESDLRKHAKKVIYTGPIDRFYDYCFGKLPYRSLVFRHEHLSQSDQFQSVGTVNYPNHEEFTRITEFKKLTGQVATGTSIVREYPTWEGDPYYPVPNPSNEQLFKKYEEKADKEESVYFIGRLAQYRYYNMDQVVGAALSLSEKLISSHE
jgi:UDP-galactopyranose mutase